MIKFMMWTVAVLTLAAQDGPHGWPTSLKISSDVFINKPLAYWKGALIRPSEDEHPGVAVPLIFNGAGEQKSASLMIPDADRIEIHDTAVADSRLVAFCGDAATKAGGAAGFVALSESGGRMLWIIQTNPYHPILITFGPNNTIWVIGQNGEDGHATLVDHFVFRIISLDGRLVGSHTLRSTLGGQGALHLGTSSRLGMSALVASSDRVGLYNARAKRWTEFGPDGTWLGSWTLPLPTYQNNGQTFEIPMRTVLLTPDNRVFAYFSGRVRGRGFYELSRSDGTWLRRDDLNSNPALAGVPIGIEGNQILVQSEPENGSEVFKWRPLN
jgi:hypothetical protein